MVIKGPGMINNPGQLPAEAFEGSGVLAAVFGKAQVSHTCAPSFNAEELLALSQFFTFRLETRQTFKASLHLLKLNGQSVLVWGTPFPKGSYLLLAFSSATRLSTICTSGNAVISRLGRLHLSDQNPPSSPSVSPSSWREEFMQQWDDERSGASALSSPESNLTGENLEPIAPDPHSGSKILINEPDLPTHDWPYWYQIF